MPSGHYHLLADYIIFSATAMQILNLYHVYDCSFNFLYTQALSASGLRALRYAREVEGIGHVVALDNDKGA